MGRFDIFPIFIATFASRRVTLIATHSKSQKQTRLPIRYLYFILPFKPLINKEVIKVFQNYKKYQSLLLSVAKKMKKAFAGAGEAVGPVRRTSRGRMSEREGGVCGERIRSRSGCALRNIFCFCLREGYLCPRCSCHCQAVRSVSSSGRSARQPRRVFASVGSAQIAVMSPARRGAKR